MRYVRLVVLLALSWSVAANAATLRLRAEDQGLWGAELRACRGRVTKSHCALITPLVMADSGILNTDLRRLPEGKKIVIHESYLNPNFRVSEETAAQARAIFAPEPETLTDNNDEAVRSLTEKLATATEEKQLAEETLRTETANLELARATVATLEARVAAAETKTNSLEKKLASQPAPANKWYAVIQMAVMFILGALVAFVFCLWWFKIFQRNNKILPTYERIKGPDGIVRGFELQEDLTYECVSCKRDTESQPFGSREKGKRIKHENLKDHLARVKHSQSEILEPIEREEQRAS